MPALAPWSPLTGDDDPCMMSSRSLSAAKRHALASSQLITWLRRGSPSTGRPPVDRPPTMAMTDVVGYVATVNLQSHGRMYHRGDGLSLSRLQTSSARPLFRACLTEPTASRPALLGPARRHCQMNGQSGRTRLLSGTLWSFRGHFIIPSGTFEPLNRPLDL
jgi:hypothetical protein